MPTPAEVTTAAQRLNFAIPPGHEHDYSQLLSRIDAQCELILSLPGELDPAHSLTEDYKPQPDSAFSRTQVHLPTDSENPLRAWAWRVEAGDPLDSTGKLLSGKSVVLKDTIYMAGVPLLFGTDAFEGFVPDADATIVTRILQNGGHILGKAACENFSHGAGSSSSPYGPVENPYAKGFTTGGLSSGCGGLIGSGAADMGIGGDQGGSIRIPATFCGIVGLKPTFGLVPYTGVLTSDSGLDHVGPMAQTVLNAALLLQATAGYDHIDDRQLGAPLPADVPKYAEIVLAGRTAGMKGMRIGYLKEAFEMTSLAPSVKTLVMGAIERCKELRAEVQEVSVASFPLTPTIAAIINKFASGGTRQGRQLLPWTQAKYEKAKYHVTGTAMSCEYGWFKYPTAYGRAMNLARKMRDEFDEAFESYDVIVMPTCPNPARRHLPPEAGPLAWADHAPDAASITAAGNVTGHPALTIPVGFAPPVPDDILSEEDKGIKLPVGMMLTGRYWDEATLLRVADAWEQSVNWKSIRA